MLYHGDQPLPDAVSFMYSLQHIPHCFITNNPIRRPGEVAGFLQAKGFARPDEQQILTSGEATALYLAGQKTGFGFFAVGADGLHQCLLEHGREDHEHADFVVIGEGAGLDYQQLTKGINLILKHHARLISTNPDETVDATINGEHVILPGGGALVAPFIKATGQQPLTIGKPHPLLYEMALQRMQVNAEDCLMIGDRPDTDISGAARLGMTTALVRTGRFLPGQAYPQDCPRPDYDVNSLSELAELVF